MGLRAALAVTLLAAATSRGVTNRVVWIGEWVGDDVRRGTLAVGVAAVLVNRNDDVQLLDQP